MLGDFCSIIGQARRKRGKRGKGLMGESEVVLKRNHERERGIAVQLWESIQSPRGTCRHTRVFHFPSSG